MKSALLDDEKIGLILNDLIEVYGYDFTGYAQNMLSRRINRLFKLRPFSSFAAFRYLLRTDPEYLYWFIAEITVSVTEMFRDPDFFLALRKDILPQLNHIPLIRIWHAGCSSGEEVYAVAILLKELGLLQKSILYATDLNPEIIKKAAAGSFSVKTLNGYAENYKLAGGTAAFADYFTVNALGAKPDDELKKRIVFAVHNLVSDSSFNHFNLIICRNVLIYFNRELQNHVATLFDNSLENKGYLALGTKETLSFTSLNPRYKRVVEWGKIWQKI